MAQNNAINAPLPFTPANGGTGVSSPTAHGIAIAQGPANYNFVTLANGQVLIGQPTGDPVPYYIPDLWAYTYAGGF